MVKSLRMDPELADRVRRAAKAEGLTEAEFMREALGLRAREVLEGSPLSFYERTKDLILSPIEGEEQVTDLDVGDIIAEKHARNVESYLQRQQGQRDAAVG